MAMTDGEPSAVAPDSPKWPGALVLLGGLTTTVVALGLVMLVGSASDGKVNLMGYYIWLIVPVSAIGVGILAGAGYGLVSWRRGTYVTPWQIIVVLTLVVCAYFAAHRIEFRQLDIRYEDGTKVGFWTWFDHATRSFTFSDADDEDAKTLGAWGYGIRLLEIAGFSLGAIIPLWALRFMSYCSECRLYMKRRRLCAIPAAAPKVKSARRSAETDAVLLMDNADAEKQAYDTLQRITTAVIENDVPAFRAIVQPLPTRMMAIAKCIRRIELDVVRCPVCSLGRIAVAFVDIGSKPPVRTKMAPILAEAGFLRECLGAHDGVRPLRPRNPDGART